MDTGLVLDAVAHHVQIKGQRSEVVGLLSQGMDGMQGIGFEQDNVTCLTMEVVISDVKLSASLMHIDDLHVRMPMKENIRIAILHPNIRQSKGQVRVGIGNVLTQVFDGKFLVHNSSLYENSIIIYDYYTRKCCLTLL